MGVLPSKPRSGDAMIAPHRARHERWCGVCGIDNLGPRRGPLIPTPCARIPGIARPLRGRGRTESNPPHTIARASLDVGLLLHRRFAAWIPPRGRPPHRVYVVPTRPALCGAWERSPEACLGVDAPPHQSGPRTGIGECPQCWTRIGKQNFKVRFDVANLGPIMNFCKKTAKKQSMRANCNTLNIRLLHLA